MNWIKLDPKDPTTWPTPDRPVLVGHFLETRARHWRWWVHPGTGAHWWGSGKWVGMITHWAEPPNWIIEGPDDA